MTRFRPCIDLHSGQVKQIVGGTLSLNTADLKTNHVSALPAAHFAELYKVHKLSGGHVIMLGPGNEEAAMEALSAWPGRLQIGGGINSENAKLWIERGAEKVGSGFCTFWFLLMCGVAKCLPVGDRDIVPLSGCQIQPSASEHLSR